MTTLVSVDPATGDVKESVEVTGNGRDGVSGLMAPEVREDN